MSDTKEKTRPQKPQKFFFDQNCFDDDYVEEIIPEEPPPPTFSEDELEAARREGYDRGRREATAEAQASREKHIATLLETISNHFQTLFTAEAQRAALYEAEAVALARAIFVKLFPALNERGGLSEIEAVIDKVLENQPQQHEIVIEVHPDYADSIEQRLDALRVLLPNGAQISVTGRDNLGPGDCRMLWDHGGGGRDATSLAQEIHSQLEHMLADRPVLHDNGEEGAAPDLPDEGPEVEPEADDESGEMP